MQLNKSKKENESLTMNEVEKYISIYPLEIQERLKQLRKIFFTVTPNLEESIRYKIPAYKLGKNYLYFAAYKKHIGMYPVYGLTDIEDELIEYRGKGTKDSLHFFHTKPLPIELIKKVLLKKLEIKNDR